MIAAPGLYPELTAEAYHRDPVAEEPSLSSTIAKILIDQTPLHAWTASPRLNPDHQPKDSTAFDLGRACHAILLGRGGEFDVVAADDWTRKADQQARKEARAAGRTPILVGQYEAALRMADICRARLAAARIDLAPGRSEIPAFARIDGVWCRAMIDNAPEWPTAPLIDYKTCESASPEAVLRSVTAYGYDVQWCWYREVWRAAAGEDRPLFFVFQEKSPPHEVLVVDLYEALGHEGDWLGDAQEKCAEARRIWRACLDAGEWPGYPTRIATLYAPLWHRSRWAEKQTIAPDPSAEALRRAAAWQAPAAE